MLKNILVPLDGSKLAEQVFPYVIGLAQAFDAEVFLLGVCEHGETRDGQTHRLYMNNEAEQLRKSLTDSTASISTAILMGKPAQQILEYTEQNDIRLIVISTHGRSGIAPWSLGGTAQKVLHKADVPLLIIRAKETPEDTAKSELFSPILMPLDGSERGEAALPYVVELASQLESEIILLQVIEPGKHIHSIRGLEYVPFKDRDMDSMETTAKDYLAGVSAKLSGTKTRTRSEVRVGDGAREIIKFTAESDCRLVAMASHGHSGIEAWVYGSVTHKVIQASNTPLLVVRTPR